MSTTQQYWQGVPHGPDCQCDVCRGQRVQNEERLTSTDRLAWLEAQVIKLGQQLQEISKGKAAMGVALWCKKGSHAFDGDDPNAERMTIDERDEEGKKTGREITVHVCSRHVNDMFTPQKKTLEEIRAEIEEATEIG